MTLVDKLIYVWKELTLSCVLSANQKHFFIKVFKKEKNQKITSNK